MKKLTGLILLCSVFKFNLQAQNSYLGIKTSKHAGILGALVNPAEIANMPQKIDVHLAGFDGSLINNVVNLTTSELGKIDSFTNNFFKTVSPEGLTARVNIDIVGPGAAVMINKKITIGLMTRSRLQLGLNNLDFMTGKALADGELSKNASLPYTTPRINNMSMNVFGWGEIEGIFAMNLYESETHTINGGGSIKGILPGGYANAYLTDFKMTIDTIAGGNVKMYNGSGNIGLEYSGSNDPLQSIFSNLLGGPKGIGFSLGANYLYKNKKSGEYILKLGASIVDIGSMSFNLNSQNSRKFVINPSAVLNPKSLQGNNFDDIINRVKASGIASEVPTDSQITVGLPTALNFTADWNIWKPFYLSFHMQQSLNSESNPRSIQAANYYSFTPRVSFRFFEAYLPVNISSVQGTTVGLGIKAGPLYLGTSSLISAILSESNKALDYHIGLRYGFGKRNKSAKKEEVKKDEVKK
jgi:hypothetical protein